MELVSEAIIFAVGAHDGMRRKQADIPYILHPVEAAAIAGSLTSDQQVIAAAVLHDVVEDAGVTLAELERRFGGRVAGLVGSETENKRTHLPAAETWRVRKEESLRLLANTQDLGVKIVYLADKLANMRAIYTEWLQNSDKIWQQFNQKDPQEHQWYYRTVADFMPELRHTAAWREYDWLIREVFGKGR